MAGTIAVRDQGTAEQWVAKANSLNSRALDVNNRVGALLRQLDEGSAGDVVDTLVQFGTQAMGFAGKIFDGVTSICTGISQVISTTREIVDTAKSVVTSILSSLGG